MRAAQAIRMIIDATAIIFGLGMLLRVLVVGATAAFPGTL
jgi:hypothetical protein